MVLQNVGKFDIITAKQFEVKKMKIQKLKIQNQENV